MISIIVAMDEKGVIGRQGKLPWGKMSADMARFKKLTTGHPVVMGRKTFESIGRALPQRVNIVITRDVTRVPKTVIPEVSLRSAIQFVNEALRADEIFVIGGGEIYKEALPLMDRLYVTIVHTEILDGDTFFPKIDKNVWKETSHEHFEADENNEFEYEFITYERPPSHKASEGQGGK